MKSKGEKTAKRKGASYRTLKKGTLMTTLEHYFRRWTHSREKRKGDLKSLNRITNNTILSCYSSF